MKKLFSLKKPRLVRSCSRLNPFHVTPSTVLLMLFICCAHSSGAQWNSINVGTVSDLYSVDYYSSNDIWIGSSTKFVRTGNNGANWILVNPLVDQFTAMIPGGMYDLELTSPTSAIATGLFYLGNSEVILTTNNSGTFWTIASLNNTGSLLRYIRSVDRQGNICIAVGNNGRISRSADGGANWGYVPSGITGMINDVKFISSNEVIAVGENVVLKSADAGQTWTAVTFPQDFHSVSCVPNCIYAAEEFTDSLFKSTDNGQTFTSMPLPFSFRAVMYAFSADTVLASSPSGLYVTFDGGSVWEKYALSGYHEINMLDFLNSSEGFAVGDSGYVIRTANVSTTPSYPLASFTLQPATNYCLYDSLFLVNTSSLLSGYTFTWKLDSAIFSTQVSPYLVLNSAGSHTISLTVTNQYGSTTVSQQITVTGHELLPFVVQGTPGTVCSGNMAILTVPNSQTGVTYRLRNGTINIGNAQTGNGSTLTFISTTGVTSPTTYNIVGSKTNMCFTDSTIRSQVINAATGGPRPACAPTGNNTTQGIRNVSFNTINNTSPPNAGYYNNYACLLNTNVIVGNTYPLTVRINSNGHFCGIWIDYDTSGTFTSNEFIFTGAFWNDSITAIVTIPSTTHIFNVPMRVRIRYENTSSTISSSGACSSGSGEYEDYSMTIINVATPPVAAFTFTTATICTTTTTFSNNTFNGMTYFWDFGDGNSSTSLQPSHSYSSSGNYTVTLIASNSSGTDTVTQLLHIQNPIVPSLASCDPVLQTASCSRILISSLQVTGPGTSGFYTGSIGSAFYNDLTCTRRINVTSDSTYLMSYQLRVQGSTNCAGTSCVWIDWNADGDFDDAGERLVTGSIGGCPSVWLGFTVPNTAAMNVPIRVRVLSDDVNLGGSCSAVCGQDVEFTIYVHSAFVPAVNFTATPTTACPPATVTFTNTTTNATTYTWDFGDGTTSNVQNPVHTYSTPGLYSITQTACNSNGNCDSLTLNFYVNIRQVQFTRNIFICAGQSYTVATNTYTTTGTYIDSLATTTGCDSIITTNLTVLPYPTVSVTPSGLNSICQGESIILSASSGLSSWQWFKGTLPIPSATAATYSATQAGRYWCIGYNAAQCADTSNYSYVRVPCILSNPVIHRFSLDGNEDEMDMQIFPNPGSGLFSINSRGGQLEIYSYTGAVIYRQYIDEGYTQFDLSEFPDGFYLATIHSGDSRILKTLILSRE
jgi:PKD repeat protein